MQCTSYTPVYYHARDLNGASGYSWQLYDSNASYGEERGYSISMLPRDQYLVYDKEVLKQIIQNHEATFRYQVQELHRLYSRQRDLMDEMRMREIFAHHILSRTSESIHSLSHAGADSQKRSPATNWLFTNLSSSKLSELTSGDVQGLVAENLQEPTTLRTYSFIRKTSDSDVQFLSPSCKRNGNEIVNLELPADMYHDDQGKQFKVGNFSEAPELTCHTPDEIFNFQPASDSDIGSIKEWDSSSSNSSIRKTNCFIDLNEPIQLESLPPSSSAPCEAFSGHNRTLCSDECVPFEAKPESVVRRHSQLLKSDGSSDGIYSSLAIDLNSMPANCFSETEMTLESPRSMNREAEVVPDCSSICNHVLGNVKCSQDEPIVHNKLADSFLKTETYIDLNTGIVDKHSLPLSSSTLEIKPAEETELKGPVSPENEERSPPRGKSENIQLETPLSSEQGEGDPFIELDTVAAQTLVKIFSSGVQEHVGAAVLEPLENFENLCWFAEIVSSTGDDLENEAMKLKNDQGEENDLNSSRFNKGKGTGNMSRRSGRGQKKGKKRCKDFQSESLAAPTSLQTGPLKRKAGRNAGAKPRKYSKISHSDVTKKSMSSILKQSAACNDQGVLQSWGKIRKREGGQRRRATKFLVIS
ncbi:hypothetical protein C2S51_006925 [Perilla frutescens var. frutescens]|nr:hypothetical protein C2S51_006925 [Perilla frutescens var. frutescens]